MKTIKLTGMILMIAMLITLAGMFAITASAEAADDLAVTIDTGAEVILKDADGDGYYDIATADELYAFAAAVIGGKTEINMELTSNITVNETVVIDNDLNTDSEKVSAFRVWPVISSFNGIVDGREHTISGLYRSDPSSRSLGFIGYTYGGTIKNLTVADSYMHGNQNVGLIIGSAGSGSVLINCKTSGVVKGESYVGGVIGKMFNSLSKVEIALDSCENSATVIATGNYAGGIIGDSREVVILNCRNTGDITAAKYLGGIAGSTYNTDTVKKCVNLGEVNGNEYVAGIAGMGSANITECINKGAVNGKSYVGGIAGMKNYSAASFSYNEGNVSGDKTVGGIVGNGSAEHCYNIGAVTGNACVGGISGYGGGKASVLNCYNIGTVNGSSMVGGVWGETYGTAKNNYYLATAATGGGGNLSDSVGQLEAKTAEEFASGEVAFYLAQSLEASSAIVWGQKIDGDLKEDRPIFGSDAVYRGYNGCDVYYSNTLPEVTVPSHSYSTEGFCTVELNDGTLCRAYQPASLANGVYQISNVGRLYWFAAVVNSGYGDTPQNSAINGALTKDIYVNKDVLSNGVLTENTEALLAWTPIGTNSIPYSGNFDGAKHTVSGIYINGENDCIGFFGCAADGAYIHDLTLTDSYIKGNNYVGGIVGEINEAKTVNCHSSATVEAVQNVGGIVGYSIDSSIENSVHSGKLFAQKRVGGIVGYMYLTDVIRCGNIGYIEIPSASYIQYAGGIVGYTYNTYNNGVPDTNVIENCYAFGTIKGGENIRIGGIVSYTGIAVKNCFSGVTIESDVPYSSALIYSIGSGGSVADSYYNNTKMRHGVFEEDDYGKSRGRNAEQLATGEVAYLLGDAWGQKLGVDAYPVLGGDTVYAIEGTSCIGTPSGTYIYSNDANAVGESGVHSYNTYSYCELCQIKITGASITAGVDLTMNYYVNIVDETLLADLQNISMRFTSGNKSVTVALDEYRKDENGFYIFSFTNIPPQGMGDNIKAELLLGETVIESKDEYSVKQNLSNLLKSNAEDEKLVQLITDMLEYGAAAQRYTQYNTSAPVTEGVEGLGTPSAIVPEKTDKNLITHVEALENVRFTSATVWFDHVNKIGVKLSSTENARLFIDGVEIALGDALYYYTDAIFATDFDKVYTFTLYEGETLVQTLTYSVSSYVYSMMSKTEADGETPTAMAELAKALYRYGVSAKAYQNSEG